ncbi:hypothetical protein SCHPADRAFT_935178 [Schizopora paradoxa]|uniref:F-box domain-containing protein n=1 Tax=Schizopora paradoxa TaxID=27342 RepID=A0A0H2S6U1_9AGAM|nr:hypothetical protein SCHPADRAFT_935178 [Schizopora paradoxa]
MDEKQKRRVRVSAHVLPPEIWLRILRWATLVPNALDTDAPDPFAYPPVPSSELMQEEIRRSLRTKRSLVLVCKLWHELSIAFLYEVIYVGLMKTLSRLEYALMWGVEKEDTAKALVKRWTKRLDIAIRDLRTHDIKPFQVARFFGSFAPNLEIVVVRKSDMQNLFCRKLMGMLSTTNTNLVVFDSTHEMHDGPEAHERTVEEMRISDDDWERMYETNLWHMDLYKFESMRRLYINPHNISSTAIQTVRGMQPPLHMPHLQFFYLDNTFPIYVDLRGDGTDLPFHLSYCGGSPSFLAEYIDKSPGLGARITTFEWLAPWVEFQEVFNVISERCPQLRNLILKVAMWDFVVDELPKATLPKNVRCLGLRSYKPDDKRPLMRKLCEAVAQCSLAAKSIRVVRFMDRQANKNLREKSTQFSLKMKSELDEKKISLEAFDGRPLFQEA